VPGPDACRIRSSGDAARTARWPYHRQHGCRPTRQRSVPVRRSRYRAAECAVRRRRACGSGPHLAGQAQRFGPVGGGGGDVEGLTPEVRRHNPNQRRLAIDHRCADLRHGRGARVGRGPLRCRRARHLSPCRRISGHEIPAPWDVRTALRRPSSPGDDARRRSARLTSRRRSDGEGCRPAHSARAQG
jgi:hypothetical protein